MRVLVVDDNPESATELCQLIREWGEEKLVATTCDTSMTIDDAVRKFEKNGYNLIVADRNIGNGRSGHELLVSLKKRSFTLKAICIVNGNRDNDVLATRGWADAYINSGGTISRKLSELSGNSEILVVGEVRDPQDIMGLFRY